MTTHWSERARQKALELKLSDVQLAKKAGWSKTIVNTWMRGVKEPKLEQKMAIADALDVTVYWLDTGEQEPDPYQLPYVSMDDLDAMFEEINRKTKAYQENAGVRFISSDSKRSFLILLENDSMIDPGNSEKKHIPEGSTVQIDVDAEPKPGKILLIEHDGRMMLRLWKRISATEHKLRIINPLYPDLNISYSGDIMDLFRGTAVGFSCQL